MKYKIEVDELKRRVSHPRYQEGLRRAIDDVAGVNARIGAEIAKIHGNANLSDTGKREQIGNYVRETAVKTLMNVTKIYRNGKAQVYGEFKHLGAPKFDPSDALAARDRAEVRTALRAAPENERRALAFRLSEDRRAAEAILSGYGGEALTGLNKSDFAAVKEFYLDTYFAEEKAQTDGYAENLKALGAAVDLAHMNIRDAAGMHDVEYNSLVKEHENT